MTTTPRLDPAALKELRQVMDDEFETLMTVFITDSRARLDELTNTRLDWLSLRRAAHAFKGSSSNVGAIALSECCLRLEEHCQQMPGPDPEADLARAEQLIAAIGEEQLRTVAFIETEVLAGSQSPEP